MPLGAFPGFKYQSETIKLKKGDTFLFHSDGLSECRNSKGDFYGEKRIKILFQKLAHQTPARIIECLNDSAIEWMGGDHLPDDMTLVVMRVK